MNRWMNEPPQFLFCAKGQTTRLLCSIHCVVCADCTEPASSLVVWVVQGVWCEYPGVWLHNLEVPFPSWYVSWGGTHPCPPLLVFLWLSFILPADLVLFDTLPDHSLSVETFTYHKEQKLVIAQPFAGRCSFMEWDRLTGKFRTYASIPGKAILCNQQLSCKLQGMSSLNAN